MCVSWAVAKRLGRYLFGDVTYLAIIDEKTYDLVIFNEYNK